MRMRVSKKWETLPTGVRVERTVVKKAPVLEWRLQAAAVRALRAMAEFGRRFTLAGDMAAAKRSPQESIKMKATGLVPGEPDLRLYFEGGILRMIEFKGEKGRESAEQIDRIALLDNLGFTVEVVKASTEDEAAARAVELVRGWLPANDNGVGK